MLTASHGEFHDGAFGKEYAKKTFAMYDGYLAGRISDFTSVGIQTPWNITKDDYTDSGELRGTKKITKDLVLQAITDLIQNYRHYFRVETIDNKISSKWADFPKTIIACHQTGMANIVYQRMNELLPDAVSVSHSKNPDDDEDVLTSFNDDESKRVLVVVRRGILGFDSNKTQVVVDMTGSRNPDTIMQLMGRIARPHPQKKQKIFFKIVPEVFKADMQRIWGVIYALGHNAYYSTYDSRWKNVKIVVDINTKNPPTACDDCGYSKCICHKTECTVCGNIKCKCNKDSYPAPVKLNSWAMQAAFCWDLIEKLEHKDGEACAAYTRMTVSDIEQIEKGEYQPWLNFTTPEEFVDWLKSVGAQ